MKINKIVISLFFLGIVGCFAPSRDSALESEVSKLLETNEVVAMSNFGQVVVNVSSPKPFDMEQEARQELAEKIAQTAIKLHPDSSTILVGFATFKPATQQIAYSWKNENGKLVPATK